MKMNFKAVLGVAGVNRSESEKARRIGRGFELLVLFALIAVFAQLVTFYLGEPFEAQWLSDLIWAVFALELTVNLYQVRNKFRYLRENWLNVAIVLIAFPLINWGSDWAVIVRSLRLILFLRFFTAFFKDTIAILHQNRFGQILLAFAFIIVGAGAVFAHIEGRAFSEGIWYAIVTITTVGYGDVVPISEEGRAFGVVLILLGVVFFSLVSANIAAFFIGSDQRKLERDILEYVKATEDRLAAQSEQNEAHAEQLMKHISKEIEDLKQELKKEQDK